MEDWWRTESFWTKNEDVTYFALKSDGEELHLSREQMNYSLQYILKIFQLSPLPYPLNDLKIKRREVANKNAFMRDEFW